MVAAIYARKSTEQVGVADEGKSVNRQIDHATQYAVRKGWTVDTAAVFVDDGVSGAEFAGRPGFVRLMNALKPRPAFQVLIMSEESRLGRGSAATWAYADAHSCCTQCAGPLPLMPLPANRPRHVSFSRETARPSRWFGPSPASVRRPSSRTRPIHMPLGPASRLSRGCKLRPERPASREDSPRV
jgi:hypothetical protein